MGQDQNTMKVEASSREEVDNISRNLNNNESPGITTITAQMVKSRSRVAIRTNTCINEKDMRGRTATGRLD